MRKEAFGLLFYDLRGPRLLFAETADLLDPKFFRQEGDPGETLRGSPPAEQARVERFLATLVEKGFVCEQPVC
ncbi:MAG: mycofactocin biosynthesis chaperone MftB [Deltaproteobacteria bacterium]|nr:mycofactocin biosynthesis chaperone MftB [Deltaproteobacteria bacterium]